MELKKYKCLNFFKLIYVYPQILERKGSANCCTFCSLSTHVLVGKDKVKVENRSQLFWG